MQNTVSGNHAMVLGKYNFSLTNDCYNKHTFTYSVVHFTIFGQKIKGITLDINYLIAYKINMFKLLFNTQMKSVIQLVKGILYSILFDIICRLTSEILFFFLVLNTHNIQLTIFTNQQITDKFIECNIKKNI